MIPTNIDKAHILKAFQKAMDEGYSGTRESAYYQVHHKGEVFPPKVIISYANIFANGQELSRKDFHGGRDSNTFLIDRGFLVTSKVRNDFFTPEDLHLLRKFGGTQYDGKDETQQLVGKHFNKELWQKTEAWASAVAQRLGMQHQKPPRIWNPQDPEVKHQIFKGYTWNILRTADQPEDQPVYYTVGLDADRNALIYKIHYEFGTGDSRSSLNDTQEKRFLQLEKEYGFEWQAIPFSKIEQYDWERLVSETAAWIESTQYDYHCLLQELLGTLPERLARICWNENQWVRPSGREGKSTGDSFEKDYGFSREEWLFDLDKAIDGYQYGRIEPFAKSSDALAFCNLHLFSRHTGDKASRMLATIHCAEKIDTETSEMIYDIYRQKGWIKQMQKQLEQFQGVASEFLTQWGKGDFFNIRFKVDQWMMRDDHLLFHPSSYRYQLLKSSPPTKSIIEDSSSASDINTDGHTRRSPEKFIEYQNIHNKIQKGFIEKLKDEGFDVRYEKSNTNHTRIDIVATKRGEVHYYEVKSYPNARVNIRQALGQLLEYSFYPGNTAPTHFGIVGHTKASNQDITYLKSIEHLFGMPVEYHHFKYYTDK